jgi:hypothetical protein
VACAAAALGLLTAGGYAVVQAAAGSGEGGASAAVKRSASLIDQVLAPHALQGFSLLADPVTVPTASYWATAEHGPSPQRETARLRTMGFVRGLSEQLVRSHPTTGAATSTVEQFRTAAGASAELGHQYAAIHGRHSRDFPVVGIPGARGVSVTTGRSMRLAVVFTSGPNYYLIDATSPSRGSGALTRAQLSAAAGWLYLTVHGCTSDTGLISPQPTHWL